MSLINTYEQFEEILKGGAYTDVGGYPLYFVMKDGEAMSFRAAEREKDRIREAFQDQMSFDRDWIPVGVEINYEDENLYCCHTGLKIDSAYGDPEEGPVVLEGASDGPKP